MKRTIGALAAAMLVLSLIAAPNALAQKKKQQKVEGTILAPARHPNGCYTGLQRHLTSLFGLAANGVLGWTIEVDEATWKKNFTLEPTGGVGAVDLDVTFYLGAFATRDEWLANPLPAAPANVGFEEHGQPGEAGKVPDFAHYALVCIYADENAPPPGVAVPFTYTAGKGVKLPK